MSSNDETRDPVVARLESLRELSWDRPDHRSLLEERIMDASDSGGRRLKWLSSKAALFLGLVLLGGVAAGATTMWILNEISVEKGTSDGNGNCTWIITYPDGSSEETEPLPEDSGWFVVDDDGSGDGGAVLGVVHADDGSVGGATSTAPTDGTGKDQ
jgi:hypothetical protein